MASLATFKYFNFDGLVYGGRRCNWVFLENLSKILLFRIGKKQTTTATSRNSHVNFWFTSFSFRGETSCTKTDCSRMWRRACQLAAVLIFTGFVKVTINGKMFWRLSSRHFRDEFIQSTQNGVFAVVVGLLFFCSVASLC